MKLYIYKNRAFLREMPFATETIEVDELPERPMQMSPDTHSLRLKYSNGDLSWSEELDRSKVRLKIKEQKDEMNARSYKTEKQVQGLLTVEEWSAHVNWCAEKRSEIHELEELLGNS